MGKQTDGSVLRGVFVGVVAAAAALGMGCSDEEPPDNRAVVADCSINVDRYKELLVVDDAVIKDPRGSNAENGAWSFRHAIEAMMPERADASAFILAWLADWKDTKLVNGFETNRESRAEAMDQFLVCPWLQATPENECDGACTSCKSRKLDLAKAPFRLVAIVNRMELATRPDVRSRAGEGRLVFALTAGPGDDPASRPLAMTMIFEYALPDSLSPKQWADAWHQLGKHTSHNEAYKSELATLTERFVGRGTSPTRPNGSSLSQVRTNESAFNWIWQLRQFELNAAGDLRHAPVGNTPGEPLNNSPMLRDYVVANAEAIKADVHVVPTSMLAGSADQFLYRWTVPDVDEATRLAFARGTCNGCHSGENTPIDVAFHLSPYKSGTAKISPFVLNEDLPKREVYLKKVLCQP